MNVSSSSSSSYFKGKFDILSDIRFTSKRYFFYIFVSLSIILIPFIKIGDNRLFMLSFAERRLEFLGALFSSAELYVIPLLIWAFAAWVLLWTSLGGRVWCGWGCPQTMLRVFFRDFIQGFILKLRHPKDKNRDIKLNSFGRRLRFILSFMIWGVITLVISANLSWYFMEPADWFAIVSNWQYQEHSSLFIFWFVLAAVIFVDIVILKEHFCRIMCPYARIQSVFFDEHTALVIYDEKRGNNSDGSRGMKNFKGQMDKSGDCTNCLACVKVCPAGIDIRDGLQLACVECLECIDACKPVMERKGLPNLIAWTTHQKIAGDKSKFLRVRPVIYGLMVVFSISVLFWLKEYKKDLSINLNHGSQTYTQIDNVIENSYILLLSSNIKKPRQVRLEIESPYELILVRPDPLIDLEAQDRLRLTFILTLAKDILPNIEDNRFDFEVKVFDIVNPTEPIDTAEGSFFIPSN